VNFIIGNGGVGSWLAPALCLLVGPKNVTLIDGDTLEEKNLNRQLFTESEIGLNKAEALARKYKCNYLPDWYSDSLLRHSKHDWLFGVVDNNVARMSVLRAVDFAGCRAIFAANETHSSEAYVYLPEWAGTRLDPRVMYAEMVQDHTNDPRSRAIGCTGEAQQANPQLVTANMMAASLAAHLYVVWALEIKKIGSPETIPHLPHKLVNNLTRNETYKVGELIKEQNDIN
jgi:hypothetical protein